MAVAWVWEKNCIQNFDVEICCKMKTTVFIATAVRTSNNKILENIHSDDRRKLEGHRKVPQVVTLLIYIREVLGSNIVL
jgi:hypothetical protein